MAQSFIARADGRLMCSLEPEERAVLSQVAGEVSDLIRMDLRLGEHSEPLSGRMRANLASEDPLARLEAEEHDDAPVREPRDVAVQRLFPAASADEREADEFRRLSQRALAEAHLAHLATLRAGLDAHGDLGEFGSNDITLTPEEALDWLKGLNAVRLVLSERMGLRNDGDFEALRLLCENEVEVQESPESGVAGLEFLASLYEFLSWLQESLVGALNSRG